MAACRPGDNTLSKDLYLWVKNNYTFIERDSKNCYCPVKSYVVVTDGSDVLLSQKNNSSIIELGWQFNIEPSSCGTNFDTMYDNTIFKQFWSLWKKVEKIDNNGNQAGLSSDFKNEIKVFNAQTAIFGVNKGNIYLIYFIILPNKNAINLFPDEDSVITPIPLNWVSASSKNIPLSYLANKIITMIKNGEILLPITEENSSGPS